MAHLAQIQDDRRGIPLHHNIHWQSMNAEQKMSLYSLHAFGYRLLFVRHLNDGPLAIVAQQSQLATILPNGEIDYQPSVKLRA